MASGWIIAFRFHCRSLFATRYLLHFGMDRFVCRPAFLWYLHGYKTLYLPRLRDLRLLTPVSVGEYGVTECDAMWFDRLLLTPILAGRNLGLVQLQTACNKRRFAGTKNLCKF